MKFSANKRRHRKPPNRYAAYLNDIPEFSKSTQQIKVTLINGLQNKLTINKITTFEIIKKNNMFKKFTLTDKILFLAAMLSLIYSEVLFFSGNSDQAIFIGLWVPSILCFGIYLNLINKKNND